MTLARSASGARYIGEGWQWWTKGAVQADLTPLIDGETMTSDKGMTCRKQSDLQ